MGGAGESDGGKWGQLYLNNNKNIHKHIHFYVMLLSHAQNVSIFIQLGNIHVIPVMFIAHVFQSHIMTLKTVVE